MAVDLDRLRETLGQHPVRLAVLFGSAASGRTHPGSDVDLVVEFEDAVADEKRELLALLTDLSIALERNDVDVALVGDLKPAVGLAAFSDGVLVVGSRERMETHRQEFERRVERIEADRLSLRERFDAAIDGVDRALRKSSWRSPDRAAIVVEKAEYVESCLEILAEKQRVTFQEFTTNTGLQAIVERRFVRMTQACKDIA